MLSINIYYISPIRNGLINIEARFVISISMGNTRLSVDSSTKPTKKQIRSAVKKCKVSPWNVHKEMD